MTGGGGGNAKSGFEFIMELVIWLDHSNRSWITHKAGAVELVGIR